MKKELKAFFRKNPELKIKPRELAKKLSATKPHNYASLKSSLNRLYKEGYLEKVGKRYKLVITSDDQLVGTFQISREGTYGFVILKNLKIKDIFIPEKYFNTVMNGDVVKVELLGKQRGKNLEGRIVEIIERKYEDVVGTLHKKGAGFFVYPDEKEIHKDIFITQNDLNGATDGDKVIAGDINWDEDTLTPKGKILQVLGKEGSYEAEISTIANEFKLLTKFSRKVTDELKNISNEIPTGEIKKRLDLRSETIFTIDPDDAKDFDDAVNVKILDNGNYEIGVHIADVSHYIPKNSALFSESLKRSTSVYLVGSVIPMLPEKLSNVVCSLVPNEDRLTYSVIAEISPTGKVVNYNITKSVINSKRRFTYDEAQEILDKGEGDFAKELKTLNKLAKTLRAKRMRKGSINFIRPEVKFHLNDENIPVEIKLKHVKDSHNLIEELMLMANQIVAGHINKLKNKKAVPFVYRIHDEPEPEKIVEFERFVSSLGYKFDLTARNKSKELQNLLKKVEGTPEESVINEIAIRSMAKAVYSTDNIGHYGLGFNHYSHFTSPIRRFPDLIVHKLLYKYLENKLEESYSAKELDEICNHASFQERNAINAERLSVKIKQMQFLENQLGATFDGIISGVTNFGIFIELTENLAEGLIRLRDIEDDYYMFDEKHYSIKGESTGKVYRLGDRVKVKLKRVNMENREVDFSLVT